MPPSTINEDTKVPVKLVAAILAMLLPGVATACFFLFRIDARLGQIEQAVSMQWTLIDQQMYVAEVKSLNPTLKIPDPVQIFKNNRHPQGGN